MILNPLRQMIAFYNRQKLAGRLNLVILSLLSVTLLSGLMVFLSLYTLYQNTDSISTLARFEKQIDEIRLSLWRYEVTHQRADALAAKDLLNRAREVLKHLPPDVLAPAQRGDENKVKVLLETFETRFREYFFNHEQSMALQSGLRKASEDLLAGMALLRKSQRTADVEPTLSSLERAVLRARIAQQEFFLSRDLAEAKEIAEHIETITASAAKLRANVTDVNIQIEAYNLIHKARLMESAFGKLRDYTVKNAINEESMNSAALAVSEHLRAATKRHRDSIAREIYVIIFVILGVTLAITLMGLVLGRRIVRTITGPLTQLVRITGEMARGDYDQRLDLNSQDELGELASSFNRMAITVKQHVGKLQAREKELSQRTEELEAAYRQLTTAKREADAMNESLEAKVLTRTAELEAANRKLSELTVTDDLTGLANRRRFDAVIADEWSRGCRARQALTVMMLDIDFFKAYNDHYGHQAGDECLRSVARILHTSARRASDLVARYGGEEFVIVAANTSLETAREMAETIRRSIESLALPHAFSAAAKVVTVSIGYATMVPDEDTQAAKLLLMADNALYRAKDAGRNRVSL